MHLMQLAHKPDCRVALVALIIALAIPIHAQEAAPLLDLTKPAPREQQETGLPGGHVGGVGGQPLPIGYLLPLKIQLMSISPQPVRQGEKFTVEVRIRNTGPSAFFLPASQNGVQIFEHEGKGRRTFLFNLVFEDPKSGRQTSSIATVAMGAETVKDSFLRIGPGKEVRVLFTGDLRPIADWLGHDLGRIQIRAGASETTFEDRRYFVKSQSRPIVSDNSESINLTEH
jgi:hypothetical protein